MEMTRSMKEEMDKEVFISRQSRHFSFIDISIEVLFRISTLNWRVKFMFPAKEKVSVEETKVQIFYIIF